MFRQQWFGSNGSSWHVLLPRWMSLSWFYVVVVSQCVYLRAEEIQFNRDVRPILAEHCLACHGPDDEHRGGGLRLDRQADAVASAIDLENPAASELLRRIESSDADEVMPPVGSNKVLTESQRGVLRAWVLAGAPYDEHWAFKPISTPELPRPELADLQPIDRFLLDRLLPLGLHFSPPVSRAQLIRRASFDLIGLPPTWDEVLAFERDDAPDAYARLLDRLLDSPRYGERWGRHWLDLARYADTHGGAAIGFRSFPFSYTYRDYVIRSFHEDMPYDRFLMEQIAADQLDLPDGSPQLAALGFLTVGMQFRNQHDTIDDRIDVITRGLMGLTVACARCHDHKFDPIPTHDYYALYASLAPSKEPAELPVIAAAADLNAQQQYDARLRELQGELDDFVRDQNEIMRSRLRMQVGLYLREIAKGVGEQDVSTEFLSYRTDDLRPIVLNRWLDYLSSMSPNDPVFGVWVQVRAFAPSLEATDFERQVQDLVERLAAELAESGWATEEGKQHRLGGPSPRWNPLVLDALRSAKPTSLLEVADIYGQLFADAHQQWLTHSQRASLEAVSEQTVIADESPEHVQINSPVHRQLRRHLYASNSPTSVSEDVARSLTNRTVSDLIAAKEESIHQLHLTSPGAPPRAMALQEPVQPPAYFILQRGNPLARGASVEPGFLSVLRVRMERPLPGKRRAALARAVTSPDNPLTPRVFVNWVWQHHFGQGLVTTPDDFGTRGTIPTHPELLDYLASQFVQKGWSIKELHKSIMLSQAYQQGAMENASARAVDSENGLLWRMPRRRLDFEAMRDAMLAVSGELDLTPGGRPVDLNAQPSVARRSIFGFINRDVVSPLLSTFDAANPNVCTAKRTETTVPQQTLFALNSDFIQDRAAKLQEWLVSNTDVSDAERVQMLYQRILSRQADAAEVDRMVAFVNAGPSDSEQDESQATSAEAHQAASRWRHVAHALLASNEFVFLD